jgi:hypothetical protein
MYFETKKRQKAVNSLTPKKTIETNPNTDTIGEICSRSALNQIIPTEKSWKKMEHTEKCIFNSFLNSNSD